MKSLCWSLLFGISMVSACASDRAFRSPDRFVAQEEGGLFVSSSGNDAAPGTAGAPLRTISAALARAKPGSTIWIEGGTYPEQVVSRVGGSVGQEITLRSFNGAAVIDGAKLPWRPGSNQNQGLVELRHPHLRLEGLKILHSKNSGLVLGADFLTVKDCEIAQTQRHGISTDTKFQPAASGRLIENVLIEGNTLHGCVLAGNGFGQAISLIADGFVIRDNRLYGNFDISIDIWLGARHGEVVGNEVFDNLGQTAVYVDGASYLRIHRNRLYRNAYGVMVSSEDDRYGTHHVWVYNNLVYEQSKGGCAIWDPRTGPTSVLFAHNTLVNNPKAFSFEGKSISAEVANNLIYPEKRMVESSTIRMHHNTTPGYWQGFRSYGERDFRLTPDSLAIDRGATLPPLVDDRGQTYPLDCDFDGAERQGPPDAGAFEFRVAVP